MAATSDSPASLQLGLDTVDGADVRAVLSGAAHTVRRDQVMHVTGPHAVQCLQGLTTNDIDAPGVDSLTYGAMLSNRGMIQTDFWTIRSNDYLDLAIPDTGVEAAERLLKKSLPPRRARAARADVGVVALIGPLALSRARACGFPTPEPGRSLHHESPVGHLTIARPSQHAPFGFLLLASANRTTELTTWLNDHDSHEVGDAAASVARIVAGWPALGYEIDAKTLPQEVRFDDLDGVSYAKGCYVGQETVARVHFRGHPNRHLRGLVFAARPDGSPLLDRAPGQIRQSQGLGPRDLGLRCGNASMARAGRVCQRRVHAPPQ